MGPWGRLVENISSKLAFFPPAPSTYDVREHADGSGELYLHPMAPDVPKVPQCKIKVIPVPPCKAGGGNTQVVTAFFQLARSNNHSSAKSSASASSSTSTAAPASVNVTITSSEQPRLTLLYSHGNAVDLGHMLPVYRELSRLLRVNVMGYDYSGYGCCTGTPTVNNTLADISAVLGCLKDTYGIPASRVILYGQSVGSGPSVWLASERPDVAGVVLHSPLLSGVRVLKPHVRWWPAWADVYPNHILAPKIKAPVLVMHGTDDEVIHISCGQKLASLCPQAVPALWANGYGHQDLEMCAAYLPTLEAFVSRLNGYPLPPLPARLSSMPPVGGPTSGVERSQRATSGGSPRPAPAPAVGAAASGGNGTAADGVNGADGGGAVAARQWPPSR